MGRTRQVTLSNLRTKAEQIYEKGDDTDAADDSWNVDDLNAQRDIPQWNNGDSYDDGSAWEGYTPDPYID